MTPDVIKVVPSSDFFMSVEFATGEVRRFDMRPYLQYPAFAKLKRPGVFLLARVEHGTVVWPEDIDLSPDTLFFRGQPLKITDHP
jgi:Protein of unknown function (DUF2442)